MRTHVEVDPRVGLNGFHAREDAQARLRLGARPADLRVPAGRPDQRSRHRGVAGARPASRAPTSSAAAPIPTPIRPRRPRASSISRAASISTSTFIWISTSIRPGCISTRCAARPTPIAGAAGSRSAMSPSCPPSIVPASREIGAPPGRCRRRRHGAAGDRPVPDGAGASPSRAARRRARASAAGAWRDLLARDQQRAQSVHAVRRLLAHPHGEPLCQYRAARPQRRACAPAST